MGRSVWLECGTPGTILGNDFGERQRANDAGFGGLGKEFGLCPKTVRNHWRILSRG